MSVFENKNIVDINHIIKENLETNEYDDDTSEFILVGLNIMNISEIYKKRISELITKEINTEEFYNSLLDDLRKYNEAKNKEDE